MLAEEIRRRPHRVTRWSSVIGAENRGLWKFYSTNLSKLTVHARPDRCQARKRRGVERHPVPRPSVGYTLGLSRGCARGISARRRPGRHAAVTPAAPSPSTSGGRAVYEGDGQDPRYYAPDGSLSQIPHDEAASPQNQCGIDQICH